ncbi:MAG TPA: hypothetical protein DEF27_04745 [Oscillatoriales bacterium UBA8482]|nr:MAG: hypothetical protein AUK43_03735 [Oscillatoriales cyanobacterium CG2_30_40_61]HBW57132.1 hypothetical protein [Oscillatoriales bacterium UBA8482]
MARLDYVPSQSSSGYLGKGAILLTILAGTMAFTNPQREEYINYASDKLSAEIKKSICKESQVPEFLKGFSSALVNTCNTLVVNQRHLIKDTVDKSTTRQNAILFSVYTTEIAGYKYQTLGGFGNFMTFPTKDPNSTQSTSKESS